MLLSHFFGAKVSDTKLCVAHSLTAYRSFYRLITWYHFFYHKMFLKCWKKVHQKQKSQTEVKV